MWFSIDREGIDRTRVVSQRLLNLGPGNSSSGQLVGNIKSPNRLKRKYLQLGVVNRSKTVQIKVLTGGLPGRSYNNYVTPLYSSTYQYIQHVRMLVFGELLCQLFRSG